jgi:hypothetical protein
MESGAVLLQYFSKGKQEIQHYLSLETHKNWYHITSEV